MNDIRTQEGDRRLCYPLDIESLVVTVDNVRVQSISHFGAALSPRFSSAHTPDTGQWAMYTILYE